MSEEIKSPCYGVCTLDADRICIGCKRSQNEILEWRTALDARKIKILENCEKRKKSE